MTAETAGPGRARYPWWPWAVAVALGAAVAILGLAFTRDVQDLRAAADDLATHAGAAQQALLERDVGRLGEEAALVESAAMRFVDATSGPHWAVAGRFIWVRDQVAPVRAAGDAVAAVAQGALRPLADVADGDALTIPGFVDGRLDPRALEGARSALGEADAVMAAQVAALGEVDLSRTVPEVSAQVREVESRLAVLGEMIHRAHVTAELLPTMLGGEEPRTYVVVVQNNAEPRATGGIPGSFIEVTVTDGAMVLGRYARGWDLIDREGASELTEDERRIFTERMAVYPQDANFTPEFPRTGQVVADFWEGRYGARPDGVLSLDPVALEWILEDPSVLAALGEEAQEAGLAEYLLNRAYFTFREPDEQDAFFARTSAAVFDAVVAGGAVSVDGMGRAVEAGRLMLWSADEEEQAMLETTPIAGAFLGAGNAMGVFLNDGSGSKIGYYVERDVEVLDVVCADGSLAGQRVTVTLTHGFDGEIADLPEYVAGGFYVPAGEFRANVLLYPAAGTVVTGADRGGQPAALASDVHAGRSMSQVRVTLMPGESVTLEYVIDARTRMAPPSIVVTPGPRHDEPRRGSTPAGGC